MVHLTGKRLPGCSEPDRKRGLRLALLGAFMPLVMIMNACAEPAPGVRNARWEDQASVLDTGVPR